MKKFLLLLVAAVLACGLVLSCSQPSAYDITLKAGSAEGVAPDSIKVEALNGSNLITWKSPSDTSGNSGYTVYRKTIIDGEIDEGTITQLSGSAAVTPIKAIAWVQDNNIETDIQYVYGVVSRSYKDGGTSGSDVQYVSEIVWQDEPEGGYVKAKKTAAGTAVLEAPPVTATIARGNTRTTTTTGYTEVKDTVVITVTGLVPDYTYKFGIAWINQSTPNNTTPTAPNERQWGTWNGSIGAANSDYSRGWTQINSGSNVYTIPDYLDYGNTIELTETTLQYTDDGISARNFDDYSSATKHYLDSWVGRLCVQYDSVNGTYPVTAPNYDVAAITTLFFSNEVKLADITK
jgi:hypothetical protein